MINKNLCKALADATNDFLMTMTTAEQKVKEYGTQYVLALQDGNNNFVTFNDDTGLPTFTDTTIDEYRSILGVRVKVYTDEYDEVRYDLYLYTDDNSVEDMENDENGMWSEGWFRPQFYGTFSWYEMLDALGTYEEIWTKWEESKR
jgi:predicted metal-binding protein